MSKKYATRNHPVFGKLDYGLTFRENERKIQIGALGFAPEFVSSCFYFPRSKTSVIILENMAQNLDDFTTLLIS
jgi:D-alanyl-D-alanine carboxypeptidase